MEKMETTAKRTVKTLQEGMEQVTRQVKEAFSQSAVSAMAAALHYSTAGANALTAALQKVQQQVRVTTTFAQKSLANFDQLQRLSADRITTTSQQTTTTTQQISTEFLAAGEKMKAMAKAIGTAFTESLRVSEACLNAIGILVKQSASTGMAALEYLWQGMMQPFLRWVTGDFWAGMAAAFSALQVLLPQALLSIAAGAQVSFALLQDTLQTSLLGLCVRLDQHLKTLTMAVHICLMDMNVHIADSLMDLQDIMHQGFQQASVAAMVALARLQEVIFDTVVLVRYDLNSAWNTLWNTMPVTARRGANATITVLNGLLSATADAMNGMSDMLGSFSGVPAFGSSLLGLPQVTAPKIPLLAQGAVLPANKPFLAVVGDQKNGTNIEAPLGVIQEAVAAVTADQTAAILAGFEASVGVQREILEAVLGISIGDDVIGNALAGYQRKQAIMRGGVL